MNIDNVIIYDVVKHRGRGRLKNTGTLLVAFDFSAARYFLKNKSPNIAD